MEATRVLDLGPVGKTLAYILLVSIGISMVLPFLWMISTSLKPPPEVIAWPPDLIPRQPTWDNFTGLFKAAAFQRFFLNSLIVSFLSTISIVFTSTLAGFVFSKFRFPLRNLLFLLILATAMVPLEVYILPLYVQMVGLKWLNSYQGLVAPYLIMSFGIFFMRQNIGHSIPNEMIDAARIDGASEWRIFRTVILPLSSSAMSALAIFAFMQAWAAFIWPLLVVKRQEMYTMELGLGLFQNRFTIEFGLISAGSVVSFIPVVVVFLLFRRNIVRGITLTGLKGV
ncbi:MAG TPA: carbohydrate ABC transporter permease [archaeon]|nr:carbohydrate ABC transporter permease [archaeon]